MIIKLGNARTCPSKLKQHYSTYYSQNYAGIISQGLLNLSLPCTSPHHAANLALHISFYFLPPFLLPTFPLTLGSTRMGSSYDSPSMPTFHYIQFHLTPDCSQKYTYSTCSHEDLDDVKTLWCEIWSLPSLLPFTLSTE